MDHPEKPYLIQANLQILQLALLDHQVLLIIEIFHDVVMALFVVLQDQGLD